MTDAIQILLSLPGFWLGWAGVLVVVLIFVQCLKFVSKALSLLRTCIRTARTWFIRLTWQRVTLYGIVALGIMPFAPQLSISLQWVEENLIHPVYVTPQDTSAWALSQYEAALERKLSPGESDIVKRRTREIAAKVGSTPQAIYEVAYSECGLNPFCIRTDGIAAGWLQFTRAGLEGLNVSLDDVKRACYNRNADFVMDVSERYLVRAAGGHPLLTSADVYTAVFAPSFVGMTDSTILYSGRNRPSYFLNAGLDGHKYRMSGNKLVWFREPDGAITISDLRLALAAKRFKFLSR